LCFLRRSPERKEITKAEAERIQSAHMANIHKMGSQGILVAAGPFDDQPRTISGIFVFKIGSLAAAKKTADQDPTVIEHRNTAEVYAWRGPDGIGAEYVRLHKLNPSTPENMAVHSLCILHTGPAWQGDSDKRANLLKAHADYVDHLRKSAKLGAAGDIEGSDDLRGLVIFRSIPVEEAQPLIDADPALKGGLFRAEYHRWWSSDHVLPW
jgi:uncharacterized protein YciI